MLSATVLDAALDTARTSKLLFSESLAVRARALVGKAAVDSGSRGCPHWNAATSKNRLREVMARMDSGELLEKLLLHELGQ